MVIKTKRAAMELSLSTIVVLVLAMTMLILGIVLVKNIFTSGTDIIKMTDEQLKKQVSGLFSEDQKLVVYPDTRRVDIKMGTPAQVGVGIKNLIEGVSGASKFSYEVELSDDDFSKKCGGVSKNEAKTWLVTGRSESNVPIPPGDLYVGRVTVNMPLGSPLCTFRYRITVKANNIAYAVDSFDVTIKPAK